MEWKRARRDETEISNRRTWESRCLRYRVQESVPKYEGLSIVYYALYFNVELNNTWEIIGRHRNRNAATKKCELHERQSNL